MALEVERKFIVNGDRWKKQVVGSKFIEQGYICKQKFRSVRVRIVDNEAFLTVKFGNDALLRFEFDFQIPIVEARSLIEQLNDLDLIMKNRSIINIENGLRWEIDEFQGNLNNLVIAEIELEGEDQFILKPEWLGAEVTHDKRFLNENLCELSRDSFLEILKEFY